MTSMLIIIFLSMEQWSFTLGLFFNYPMFVSIDIHNHELLYLLSREMERLEQEAKMKELEELRRKV